MRKGKRYDEPQLNKKKVFGVIITIAVIIMIILSMKRILTQTVAPIVDSKYTYYTIYSEGKWGVVNNKGEEVIHPSNTEMIAIPDKEKAVFVCIYDVNE